MLFGSAGTILLLALAGALLCTWEFSYLEVTANLLRAAVDFAKPTEVNQLREAAVQGDVLLAVSLSACRLICEAGSVGPFLGALGWIISRICLSRVLAREAVLDSAS